MLGQAEITSKSTECGIEDRFRATHKFSVALIAACCSIRRTNRYSATWRTRSCPPRVLSVLEVTLLRRRKFLASLGALPIIADWKEALGYTRPKKTVRDQKWKDMFMGVEILRLINTVEVWNFHATGEHVALEHLHECTGYKKLMEVYAGRFRGVTEKFPANGGFQVNGYDISVVPGSTDPSKYLAAVSMKGSEYGFTFVTDELGRIFEGRPLGTQIGYAEIGRSLVEARAKERDTPLTTVEIRWWPKLFATIMFSRFLGFAIPAQGSNWGCACCTATFPCVAPENCYCDPECPGGCPSGESYCCVNCGTCAGCTWLRYKYCELLGGCDCGYNNCNILECCFQGSGDYCICQCG